MNAPRESPARIAELLALYRRTRYRVLLPAGGEATLRVGAAVPAAVAAWIGTARFAVYLTACNPHSQALPSARNAERMAELRQVLREAGARWLEGSGGIPGAGWTEASLLAAALPVDRADRIARAFGQNASLRVAAAEPVRLRLHRSDWRTQVASTADLEHDAI